MITEIDQVQKQHVDLQASINDIKTTIAQEKNDSSSLRDRIDGLNRSLETGKNDLMKMVAEEARVEKLPPKRGQQS